MMSNYKTKACFLFRVGEETEKVLSELHGGLIASHPALITRRPGLGDLPYHFTILATDYIDSRFFTALIKSATKEIVPFFDASSRPVILGIEPTDLPYDFIGVKLIFRHRSFVITGSPEKNRGLARKLNAGKFNFDMQRHITIAGVRGHSTNVDKVLPELKRSVDKYYGAIMHSITLSPEIWTKDNQKGNWKKFE